MAPTLSDGHRRLLEIALEKYPTDWDEAVERVHPHLRADRCVRRREDWLGKPGRPGIVGWKSTWALTKATWGRAVPRVTREAFALAATGSRENLVRSVEKLDELPGVGVRMATAILTFYDPLKFTVMDVNAWGSLVHLGIADPFDFGYELAEDYPPYNDACRELSLSFHHTLRETDRALWVLGASKGRPDDYGKG